MKSYSSSKNFSSNSINFPKINANEGPFSCKCDNYLSFESSHLFKNKKNSELYKVKKHIELEGGFMPFKNKDFHLHPHLNNEKPHIHSLGCDPFVSGYDLQRETRYYFTTDKTPVRCYIKYDEIKNKVYRPTISKSFMKEVSNMK
jgi:hypothetical protein